ncbi:protein Ycf2-like [Cucumis melo var. makuwa]|uniref:Protein Ycf2-like n=1 Tax=Cucumis melo var. makuwa TaxID=1194695 RepID=A0A5A7UM43_CUCMM|nr:protein Ycf2-like [Cucumis melo var. makuwa]
MKALVHFDSGRLTRKDQLEKASKLARFHQRNTTARIEIDAQWLSMANDVIERKQRGIAGGDVRANVRKKKIENIKMKKRKGEVRTRTSDRLRAAGITGSKKRLPTGIQTLSSSSDEVSKSRVYKRKSEEKKQKEVEEKGRVAFELLVEFMNKAICSKEQTEILMGGFIFPILVWANEVIPTLSTPPNYFATRISNEVPRIINWAADTQSKWKDLKQKVFDSPTLEVSPMLATPNEVERPYFAPFLKAKKDILKEAEDEL